ncbi:MAG: hypothetical protein IJ324_08640 [Lachnospiraceae bacterium]|nr:hypothetical protein [Lachnospiraceae bacterium]
MATTDDKKKINEEKKELKRQQKLQKKEAKRRAKEISKQEVELDEAEDGGGISTFLATIFIVVIWLAVICVIIKLDVGGFGTNVLTPLLKDVPVVNLILPGTSLVDPETGEEVENYGGYSDLKDAVDQIRLLEAELETVQASNAAKADEITELKAEVTRLKEYEKLQAEFQRIQTQFYEEVVTAEEGPGLEAYKEYYEEMDPTTAEYIYRQVIVQIEESTEIQDYAAAYSEMKPKQAAGIFEQMTSDLDLVARILKVMDSASRGEILGAMDPEVAAKITKIMDPES